MYMCIYVEREKYILYIDTDVCIYRGRERGVYRYIYVFIESYGGGEFS